MYLRFGRQRAGGVRTGRAGKVCVDEAARLQPVRLRIRGYAGDGRTRTRNRHIRGGTATQA